MRSAAAGFLQRLLLILLPRFLTANVGFFLCQQLPQALNLLLLCFPFRPQVAAAELKLCHFTGEMEISCGFRGRWGRMHFLDMTACGNIHTNKHEYDSSGYFLRPHFQISVKAEGLSE
jgi:hypothetical protein